MGTDIVRPGLRTKVEVKMPGGNGLDDLALIVTKREELREAEVDLQIATMRKAARVDQKATLSTRKSEIVDQTAEYQAIVDDPLNDTAAVDYAQDQIDTLAAEDTEIDDTITAIDALITESDTEISTFQSTVDTRTSELEALESAVDAGLYTKIPNVEEVTIPDEEDIFDSFRPIDGESEGYNYNVPTGAVDVGEFGFTIVSNNFQSVHQYLRYIKKNKLPGQFRIILTDGYIQEFQAYVQTREMPVAADKLNRTKYTFMPNGAITDN